MAAKHGAAHTGHSAETVAAVAALLARHVGPENAATWDRLARESGIAQRRLRACATALDGKDWLLGVVMPEDAGDGEPRGVFLASSPEEAEGLTRMIVSKATDEMARANRRADYALGLTLWPRATQLELFGRKGEAA